MEFEVEVTKPEKKHIYLAEGVIGNILLRIPLKPLTRFKLVSKHWCKTITELRQSAGTLPLISSSLIVLHTRQRDSSEVTRIIKLEDEGKRMTQIAREPTYFDYPMDRGPPSQMLVDSMNGWLLFYREYLISRPYLHKYTELVIWDPILRQAILLPKIPETAAIAELDRTFRFSMYRTSKAEVKIMRFRVSENRVNAGEISYFVFSPVDDNWTGQWTQSKARVWNLRWLGKVEDNSICKTNNSYYNIHFNGVRYKEYLCWLLGNSYMLIYNLDKSTFHLLRLPLQSRDWIVGMLWESEGVLYYMKPNMKLLHPGFFLWSYTGCKYEPWRLQQDVTFTELSYSLPLRPLVFNYESQTLYLDRDHKWLYAYSFETRKLSAVSPPSSLDPKCRMFYNM